MTSRTNPIQGTGKKLGLLARLIGVVWIVAAVRGVRDRRTSGSDGQGPADLSPPSTSAGDVHPLVARFDTYQRSRPWLAFPLAVVKKFGEDKAGHLAALVAYFGFFSVFPLMLAFTSTLGFVVTDPDAQREFSNAAADQIPVVGRTIRATAGQLEGSVIALVIGVALALWSGLRIVDAIQNALNDVWDIPRLERPNLAERRIRGVLMLALLGGGLVSTVAASSAARFLDVIPGAGKAGIWLASAAVSVLLYLFAFQLLTDIALPWRDLWPGAIFGGLAWWALQTFGAGFIVQQQESAGETYGDFAAIIALMAFFFIAAQLSIVGAEISVVRSRSLWPRSFAKGRYTPADLAAFDYLATSTQQDESYTITVSPGSAHSRHV